MGAHGEKAGIFIVEDEVLIAADLESRLIQFGYTIRGQATSAEEALLFIERERPDLIMMDIMLPGEMDGIDAAEIIREQWGIPVIFVTAQADSGRLERAKLTYPFGYILKPFQSREIGITVEMALYIANVDAERKQVEARLAEQFSITRGILNSAAGPIFSVDRAYRYTGFNQAHATAMKTLYGMDIQIGHNMLDFLTVERDRDNNRKNIDRALEGERVVDSAYFGEEPRSRRYYEVNHNPIKNESGDIIGVSVFAMDITQRKRVEEALRESEGFIRAIMDNLPIGVAVNSVDPCVDFKYTNDNFTKFYRTSKQALADPDSFWEAVYHDPEFREKQKKRVLDDCASGDPKRMYWEDIPIEREGEDISFITAMNIPVPGKQLMISTVWDVTQRKRVEADKEKLEKQLRQSQKMEAVGTLAGGISHDFNNLLQAINGYSQILLLDKTEDDPDYPSLKAIRNAGMRAADLVRQLLLFSRKVEAERRPVDLNHGVEQAKRLLERTIPKMIDIELHLGSRLWAIDADPVQMEQILLNLGKNAADAMPDGGTLVVETENIIPDEHYVQTHLGAEHEKCVLLTVSDNGYGMDRKTVEHIFEPFYTTKEIGKGTGLGLASVYAIVKSHGGHITCYSEVGLGTTFKILLPAIEQVDTDADMDVAIQPPQRGTETILIVDDEESIRVFASQVLEKFGYTVSVASSGEEAVEIYSGNHQDIDLVILDIGMPGMGGHKCFRELQRINLSTKVVIASGYSLNNRTKKTLEAGAKGFVGKPYHVTDLLSKVRAVLDMAD